jgi:hypothetical protein
MAQPKTQKKAVAAKASAPTTRARRATASAKPTAQRRGNGNGNHGSEDTINSNGNRKLGKGGLEAIVLDHLKTNPKSDFTPAGLGRTLGRSSGAVANALDKFTEEGTAIQTSEKPKRYKLATKQRRTARPTAKR